MIGPYRLQERIGHGGMGVVYRAIRADKMYTREVAIKLLPFQSEWDEGRKHLTREIQILAQLAHPHIAKLLDGGESDAGQVFLVMEYVDGVSILDYCTQHALGVEGRIALFQQICGAVHYLHQRLVNPRRYVVLNTGHTFGEAAVPFRIPGNSPAGHRRLPERAPAAIGKHCGSGRNLSRSQPADNEIMGQEGCPLSSSRARSIPRSSAASVPATYFRV